MKGCEFCYFWIKPLTQQPAGDVFFSPCDIQEGSEKRGLLCVFLTRGIQSRLDGQNQNQPYNTESTEEQSDLNGLTEMYYWRNICFYSGSQNKVLKCFRWYKTVKHKGRRIKFSVIWWNQNIYSLKGLLLHMHCCGRRDTGSVVQPPEQSN